MLASLRRAGVPVPRAVSAAARSGATDLGFILRLAAAIVAQRTPVVLVLDELHLVTDQRCLNGLARLLLNARPFLRAVVASRSDPLLPLHRYRLAGELTEIRARELAFSVGEAGLLLAHHGISLPAESLEFLTERAEGWVAALRLAAISMRGDPHPEQFVKELVAENSPVASYLVEEVLNAQPAEVRNLLLKTSILDRVNAGLAGELAGDEAAGSILAALAQGNALVQPLHEGWYRYHSLFAEVLRLKLQRDDPAQVPRLRRRAAEWLRRHGMLAEAARQAAQARDWELAARIVVDELAVGRLVEHRDAEPLASVLSGMPSERDWAGPQPWLVRAALMLPVGADDEVSAALAGAEGRLRQMPREDEAPSRLAAATIRLGLSRRRGDLAAAKTAAAAAVASVGDIPADLLAAHPEVQPQVMAGVGVVQFWSGRFEQAAGTLAGAAAGAPRGRDRAESLGTLALVEALRGRLERAAALAAEAPARGDSATDTEHGSRAAAVARAYVHLERNELAEARRELKNADPGPQPCQERLITAVACLVAARGCLAEGRPAAAWEIAGRAGLGWSPAPWLEHSLALVESHARAAAGDAPAALSAARRAAARPGARGRRCPGPGVAGGRRRAVRAGCAGGGLGRLRHGARPGPAGRAAGRLPRLPRARRPPAGPPGAGAGAEAGRDRAAAAAVRAGTSLARRRAAGREPGRRAPGPAGIGRARARRRAGPARHVPGGPGRAAEHAAGPSGGGGEAERTGARGAPARVGDAEHDGDRVGHVRVRQHGQEPSQERVPQAGRGQQERGGPPGPRTRADLRGRGTGSAGPSA